MKTHRLLYFVKVQWFNGRMTAFQFQLIASGRPVFDSRLHQPFYPGFHVGVFAVVCVYMNQSFQLMSISWPLLTAPFSPFSPIQQLARRNGSTAHCIILASLVRLAC